MASPTAALLRSSPSPLHRLPTFRNTSSSSSSTQHPAAASPLDSFASDPILSSFLSAEFSPSSFSTAALSSGSPASPAEHLDHAIRLLESQLRSEVLSFHDDLLHQLSSLHHADRALSSLRSSVSSLQASLRRVRSEVSDPIAQIRLQSLQLSNFHLTTELLSHAIRALRLSKKLPGIDTDPERIDLAKAAQLHCEILGMCEEYGLIGVYVIDEELAWVKESGAKLRSEAMKVLERGMEGLNQAEVGSGLQVFYNLGELKGTLEILVKKYKEMTAKSIGAALDMRAITGGGSGYGPGGVRGTPQIGGGVKAVEPCGRGWEAVWIGCIQLLSPCGICRGSCRRRGTHLRMCYCLMRLLRYKLLGL